MPNDFLHDAMAEREQHLTDLLIQWWREDDDHYDCEKDIPDRRRQELALLGIDVP